MTDRRFFEVVDHASNHWTNGGTGLTNFGPEEFEQYRAAARNNGNDRIVVSEERMLGRGHDMPGGSLHYTGDIRTPEGQAEVSEYWRAFGNLKDSNQ